MKNRFPGYFDLNGAEHEKLWEEGLVVVDTNVLLDLYRVPETTRTQMFELLHSLKGRIWVPHQVGVEFLGMRVKTINEVHRRSTTVVEDLKAKHKVFRAAVDEMKLTERGISGVPDILNRMDGLVKRLSHMASSAFSSALKPTGHDHILERIDAIVDGNVGEAPANQDFLNKIYKEGALRYEHKMGPGYEDAKKADRKGASYHVGGLIYESQYSDLVLWKQTIAHVKFTGAKSVIFLSKDAKKDWWQIVNGEDRIAPLPELREEMIREGGAERFWIVTLTEALEKYGRSKGVDVEQAIKDVRQADLADFANDDLSTGITSSEHRTLHRLQTIEADILLRDASKALRLDVSFKSGYVLSGWSPTAPNASLVLTTGPYLDWNHYRYMDAVEAASREMQMKYPSLPLRLVVVIPEGSSEGLIADAYGFGSRIVIGIRSEFDQLIVGVVVNDQFITLHERTVNKGW